VNVRIGKPTFKEKKTAESPDISLFLGITTDTETVAAAICFPKRTFLNILEQMLGEEVTELSEETEDGALELVNMVFNEAKRVLSKKGFTGVRTIPTVVFGDRQTTYYLSRVRPVLVPCTSKIGNFWIEFTSQKLTQMDRA